MKNYNAHVQFDAISITVRAKDMTEAKKKILAKVAKKKPVSLIDRSQLFIERED